MEEFKSKVEELYGDFLREIREIEQKWQREWYEKGIFNATQSRASPSTSSPCPIHTYQARHI
ncbi:hypothetical protein [Vulcanisaeta sp. JCM 14467]|uniref:hypothetical protein n=1 Tax=Vulcanisaeta sp. JCM 14467 TaxID=1295370 RepID=UPI0020933A5D|nr:hypothetical protein [Vulcanisaeta sp. JCM 14467]